MRKGRHCQIQNKTQQVDDGKLAHRRKRKALKALCDEIRGRVRKTGWQGHKKRDKNDKLELTLTSQTNDFHTV
jgi:predicted  nucleic acid-binding Zn-ribbon protein